MKRSIHRSLEEDAALVAAMAGVDKRTLRAALADPSRIRSAETRAAIVLALRARGHIAEARSVKEGVRA